MTAPAPSSTSPTSPTSPSGPAGVGPRLFGLRAGELPPVLVLFLWYFCVIGAAFVGRAVRDSLFLAHLGSDKLPYMYMASPLVTTLIGLGYARIEGKLRRDRLVIGTAAGCGAFVLAARLLIDTGAWINYSLYIFVNVMNSLVIVQLWTVAGDRFSSRDAKRLFGLIGAGGTTADVIIGLALTVLAGPLGADNLLYLCAGLLFAAAGFAVILRRMSGGRLDPTYTKPRLRAGGKIRVPGASHLAILGACFVFSVAVVTLVEFQFKAVTGSHFGGDDAGMVRYFGYMSIATGVVSLAIQLLVTGRLLERLGVAGVLLALPLGLGGCEVALFVAPGLIAATILKMSDETLRFTINDAATQLVYLPVPSAVRGRFKALLDAGLRPGAQLVVGMALYAYRAAAPGSVTPLVVFALVMIVIWVALIVRLRSAYVRSLRETLRQRPAELEVGMAVAAEEIAALRSVLQSGTPDELLPALDLARPVGRHLVPELTTLVGHADPRVRAAACTTLAAAGVSDPLRAHLDDEDPAVRAAALAGLLADPAAHARLDALLTSPDPGERVRAAQVLAGAGRTAFNLADAAPKLRRLLEDPNPRVSTAALSAAAALADPALVAPLLAHLARRTEAAATVLALGACGAGAEAALAAALADEKLASPVRADVARALGLVATPAVAAPLVAAIDAADLRVRTAAGKALSRAARRTPDLGVDRARIAAMIDVELRTAYLAIAAAEGLGRAESLARPDGSHAAPEFLPADPAGAAALISRTLRERQEHARDRTFALLGALHPSAGMEAILANLTEPDPARRANAVELIDSILDAGLRARLVPLLDESPRYTKLAAVEKFFDLPRRTRDAWLTTLLDEADPWMLACAAYYAGAHDVIALSDRLTELVMHPSPPTREAAFLALARLHDGDAMRLKKLAALCVRDTFPPLRARALEMARA